MEADDVLAWLTTQKFSIPDCKVIITEDKDMLQLVDDKVEVYLPMKKKLITATNFESEFDMLPKHFLYYKAALGDKSDNVDGLQGVGLVTAKKIAKTWFIGSNQSPAGKLTERQINIMNRNIEVMDLCLGYKKAGKEEVAAYKKQIPRRDEVKVDEAKFIEYCEKYNFNTFLDKLDEFCMLEEAVKC